MARVATKPVQPVTEADHAKDYWSTNHCQSVRVPTRDDQPHRYELAEYIAALRPQPSSVLEFGCASARNLAILSPLLAAPDLVGIDANTTTISNARDAYPDMYFMEGDEGVLPQLNDNAYDLVLSVSVLDHIPAPEWRGVYDELVRVARLGVVLLEPITGMCVVDDLTDGTTVRHTKWYDCDVSELNIDSPPFSYVHDYLGHDPLLRLVRPLPVSGLAKWEQFGRLYALMHRDK